MNPKKFEMIKNILIPDMTKLKKQKYIIYGTKDVAEIYYEVISQMYGSEYIEYFIDGSIHAPKLYKNRKVLKVAELTSIELTEYFFLIGSITDVSEIMMINLLEAGVKRERIMDSVPYFKLNYLQEVLHTITRIVCCEVFKTELELTEWLDRTRPYFDYGSSKVQFHYFLKEKTALQNKNIIVHSQKEISLIEKNDILMVRNVEDIVYIRQQYENRIICVDDEFEPNIMGKIFALLSMEKNFDKIFSENFEDLLKTSSGYDGILICGNGPSLQAGIEKQERGKKKLMPIVCNDFFKVKKVANTIQPRCYVVSDDAYYQSEYRDVLIKLIQYVNTRDCKLCFPNHWANCLIEELGLDEKKAIGFTYVQDQIIIPSARNLQTCVGGNVLLTLAIPIALACTNDLYFIGCDGIPIKEGQVGLWKYQEGIEAEEYDNIFRKRKFVGVSQNVDENQMILMNKMYGRLLGELISMERNYFTVTHSNFSVLEKFYKEEL